LSVILPAKKQNEERVLLSNHIFGGRMAFERVASMGEIPAGSIREVLVAGQAIALANVAGTVYAISGTCLHRGGPLGEGQLEGKVVTCPWHGWQFDVTTGKAVQNPNAGVGCYAVEVRGEEVFVSLG
jgi:nitrite reductase/ring-hydroxylating ferredoxin subunit